MLIMQPNEFSNAEIKKVKEFLSRHSEISQMSIAKSPIEPLVVATIEIDGHYMGLSSHSSADLILLTESVYDQLMEKLNANKCLQARFER